MNYYRDVDTGNIVRTKDDSLRLEYVVNGTTKWIETDHDHKYEREHWLGEGNTCLFDIPEEEALSIISSWNTTSTIEQMVDGILGKDNGNLTERQKELRRNLLGRAAEYLMFMDD